MLTGKTRNRTIFLLLIYQTRQIKTGKLIIQGIFFEKKLGFRKILKHDNFDVDDIIEHIASCSLTMRLYDIGYINFLVLHHPLAVNPNFVIEKITATVEFTQTNYYPECLWIPLLYDLYDEYGDSSAPKKHQHEAIKDSVIHFIDKKITSVRKMQDQTQAPQTSLFLIILIIRLIIIYPYPSAYLLLLLARCVYFDSSVK
jgi:hypothetical protein